MRLSDLHFLSLLISRPLTSISPPFYSPFSSPFLLFLSILALASRLPSFFHSALGAQALLLRSPSLTISRCVSIDVLADRCVGYVAADLHSLVKESVYHALTRRVYNHKNTIRRLAGALKASSSSSTSFDSQSVEKEGNSAKGSPGHEREKDLRLEDGGDLDAVELIHVDDRRPQSSPLISPARKTGGADKDDRPSPRMKHEENNHRKKTSSRFSPFASFDLLLSEVQQSRSWGVHTPDVETKDCLLEENEGDGSSDGKSSAPEEGGSSAGHGETVFSGSGLCPPPLSSSLSLIKEDFDYALRVFVPSYKKTGAFLPRPNVRWEEVGGLVDAKKEIEERILFPLNFPDFYETLGVSEKDLFLRSPQKKPS